MSNIELTIEQKILDLVIQQDIVTIDMPRHVVIENAFWVDGREVELQNNGTFIQWRYVGDIAWIDLVALADITWPQGDQGIQGEQWIQWIQGEVWPQWPQGVPWINTRWSITGTLSDQIDLQDALDTKQDIINKTSIQTRINESWDEIILQEVPIEDITVMKNRVIQYKDIDYEITGGVTITFFTPFSNADIMVLPYMY